MLPIRLPIAQIAAAATWRVRRSTWYTDRTYQLSMTTDVQTPPEKRKVSDLLIGRPLETRTLAHQVVSKKVGLAVFASDAISSTAYATEEILVILALAGSVALGLSIPIAVAIAVLLVIVTISYRQTIYAYPNGGGAYIVARENLGETAALIAGSALLTDYVLTVAVSISSGVAQIISAFPDLAPFRVYLAVIIIGVVTLINPVSYTHLTLPTSALV